jgi:hypothetical protein
MKNKTNNRLLVLTTVAAITLSGCASKKITVIEPTVNKVTVPHVQQVEVRHQRLSKWQGITKNKKEDCVDCYATILKEPVTKVASAKTSTTVYGYDYAQNKIDTYTAPYEVEEEYQNPYVEESKTEEVYEEGNSYLVDASYSEDDNTYESESKNLFAKVQIPVTTDENSQLLGKNSIQVGAFRKYAGAKVYAKRYSLLTSKYNVDIKANVKNNQPIYRVQIEGFSNEREAKEFMNRYGLDGAFLVRR